jgi:hypothetical protein
MVEGDEGLDPVVRDEWVCDDDPVHAASTTSALALSQAETTCDSFAPIGNHRPPLVASLRLFQNPST